MCEKAILNGEEVSFPIAPINLLFGTMNKESVYLDRVDVTPLQTIEHFNALNKIDKYSACFFKIVVEDFRKPLFKHNVSSLSHKHLIGLFSISLRLLVDNKKFVWKQPESFLHPRYQANLADVIIIFSNLNRFNLFIDFVNKGYFDQFILGVEEDGKSLYSVFDSMCNLSGRTSCSKKGSKTN